MTVRRRTLRILILALCIYALVGIIAFLFIAIAHDDYRKEITIEVDDTPSAVLDMSWLDINPGESFEYVVNLKCRANGDYSVNFSFGENTRGGLEDFVEVELECGEISYNGDLSALIDTDRSFTFDCYLSGESKTKILIRYSMPYEVGNDAQGTFADFSVLLTTSKG